MRRITTLYQGGQEVYLVQCPDCLQVMATIDEAALEEAHKDSVWCPSPAKASGEHNAFRLKPHRPQTSTKGR